MGMIFGDRLPFAMQAVTLPRWYSEVAPTLPPGRVLLSYPAPFSGLQNAMAWQAVNRMHYSQAGGGGPQGVAARAGSAKAGFEVLSRLDFGVGLSEPAGTPAQYAAVRHALSVWQVNTVVIATDPAAPRVEQGHDPVYAAAFMTAALGRQPTLEAGAWVWNNVRLRRSRPLVLKAGTLATCTAAAEPTPGVFRASMQVAECVAGGALSSAVRAMEYSSVGHERPTTRSRARGRRLPAAGSTDRAVPPVPARAEGNEKDGAGVTRWGVRGLLGAACLLLSCAGLPALASSPAGGATVARADASGRRPGGLPSSGRPVGAGARRAGALGCLRAHPVRLLVLGDSIAMTLGMGLSVNAQQQYGVSVTDDATVGCDLDPQLQVVTSGAVGPATPGCDNWRGAVAVRRRGAASPGGRPGTRALGDRRSPAGRALGAHRGAGLERPPDGRSAVCDRHPALVWCQSGAVHHALRRPQ